ncbi:MAG: ferric reductase-like transmembrane domain-containing protein [Patescibacteria group bacterium]
MTYSRSKTIFYILFLLIPIIWWIVTNTNAWGADFYSQFSWWGRLSAIAAIGMFSGNLLLSGRHKVIDAWFQGLDRVYALHRQTGVAAWTLITVHALYMGLRFVDLGWIYPYRVWFELPAANLGLLLGRIGFLLFTGILLITLFSKMKYETKKLLHMWLGFSLLLGSIHALLISSFLADAFWLRNYLVLLVAVGTLSFIWRTVLGTWLVPTIKTTIQSITPISKTTNHLVLSHQTQLSNWKPGQFAFIRIQDPNWKYDDHPFSIIQDPNSKTLEFAIKAVGDFTTQLPNFKPNTPVLVEGPYGGFSYLNSTNINQIWIAGGIGITPLLAMARHLTSHTTNHNVHLYYSVTTKPEAIYLNELEQLANNNPQFTFTLIESQIHGKLTTDQIIDTLQSDYFICGPIPMINSLVSQLKKKGVPSSRIHFEKFKLF